MPIVNIPESRIVKLVDLSEDSINRIAEAVAQKIAPDAAEVVRRRDCKFNYANQIPSENACQLCVELPISDEFYCAYGERIENEAD